MFGHIPLATCYELLTNGPEAPASRTTALTDGPALYRLIAAHRVPGLFEGHLHVNELYRYKDVSFIDTGAICGNWWNGTCDGHPEGFNLVHVYKDSVEAEYMTYGWDASLFS